MARKLYGWKEPKNSPKAAVDVLIIKGNKILLLDRQIHPYKGRLDLIGGTVEYGETVEQAAIREAKEESGLKIRLKELLGVYSDPKRDPRFHSIAIAFIAEPVGGKLRPSFEGPPRWHDIRKLKISSKYLAFDHAKILKDYIKWKKKKGTYWSTRH